MQIYLLENQGEFVRLYANRLGSLKTKMAEYFVYSDYKGREWLHIYYIENDEYFLWPFIRIGSGEEYIEYLKHI